jgi:hypothetical protein
MTINNILKIALAIFIIGCNAKGDIDFVGKWESGVKGAVDSCGIRNVKVYFLRHLDFIARKGIRNKIVQGIGKDWSEFKAIEDFGDDPNDYFANILLDDTVLYTASFERESELFTMSKVPKGSRDYEREIYGFEDFPKYKVECDSSANIIFYFKGRKD